MHRSTFCLVALLVTALLAAGCGDKQPNASAPSPTGTASATAIPGSERTATPGKTPAAGGKTPGATPTVTLPKIKKPSRNNPPVSAPAKSVEECLSRSTRYGPTLQKVTTALCNADPAQGLTATKPSARDKRLIARAGRQRKRGKVSAAAATLTTVCESQARRRLRPSALDEGIALCRRVQAQTSRGAN